MPKLGWRYLVAISALPLGIFVLLFQFVGFPESLMYLATTGQRSKLQEELTRVSFQTHLWVRNAKLFVIWQFYPKHRSKH